MPAPRSQRVTCDRLTPSMSASCAAERKSARSASTLRAVARGIDRSLCATYSVAQQLLLRSRGLDQPPFVRRRRRGVEELRKVFFPVAAPMRTRAVDVGEAVLVGERPGSEQSAGLLANVGVRRQRGDAATEKAG